MRLVLAALLLSVIASNAQAGGGSVVKGTSVAYVGPADTVGVSATHFWGVVAMDADRAAAGANLFELERNGGTTCVVTSKTDGTPDLDSLLCSGATEDIETFCGANCRFKTLYDQGTGATNMVQATRANQIPVLFSCSGTLPCPNPVDNTDVNLVSASALRNQPMSFVAAYQRVSSGTTRPVLKCGTGGNNYIRSSVNANQFQTLFGSTVNYTVGDGAFHSIQGSISGASSFIKVDAAANASVNPGTGGCAANVRFGSDGTTNTTGGKLLFFGIWDGLEFSGYDEDAVATTVATVGQF